MFTIKTKKRIHDHKWNTHSNVSLFFDRIEKQSKAAIKDLTLLAENLEEEQLGEIFTSGTLTPLLRAILIPKKIKNKKKDLTVDNDRIFLLSYMFLIWSLESTGRTISSRLGKAYYSEHEKSLRSIVDTLYFEKIKK